VQPPNDKALLITAIFLVATLIIWVAVEERRVQGRELVATAAGDRQCWHAS